MNKRTTLAGLVSLGMLYSGCTATPIAKTDTVEASATYLEEQASPKVHLIVFGDYSCPFTQRLENTLQELLPEYENKVKIEFKHFPLTIHPDAGYLAEAAECARLQGVFDEFSTNLLNNQYTAENDTIEKYVRRIAQQTNLDTQRFESDLAAKRGLPKVMQHIHEANALGLNSTPTLYVNGTKIIGAMPASHIKETIDIALEETQKPTLHVMQPEYEALTDRSYNLSNFPQGFVTNGQFNGVGVVGDNAPGSDVRAWIEISIALNSAGVKIPVLSSKLASEVPDLKAQNTILISTGQHNPLVLDYFGVENQSQLEKVLDEVGGVVAAKTWENGNTTLYIGGATPMKTWIAARALKIAAPNIKGIDCYAIKVSGDLTEFKIVPLVK